MANHRTLAVSTPTLTLSCLLLLLFTTPTTAQSTRTITASAVLPSTEPLWTSDDSFTSDVMDAHNSYRSDHAVSTLTWNDTLAEYSADYLDSDGDGDNDCPDFEHSDTPYGENLAIGHQNATHAVEAWGDERDLYDFDDQGFDKETGHFTQMVWRNTTDVGCARKFCLGDDREIEGWYLVCEYWPPGNVQGQFEQQVSDGDGEWDDGDGNGGIQDDEGSASGLGVGSVGSVVMISVGLSACMIL